MFESFIRLNGIRLRAALRSAALARFTGLAGGGLGGGTSSSRMTKLPLPVPVLLMVSFRFWVPPAFTNAESGRGLAPSKPAAREKSRRTALVGMTVVFFVSGS